MTSSDNIMFTENFVIIFDFVLVIAIVATIKSFRVSAYDNRFSFYFSFFQIIWFC